MMTAPTRRGTSLSLDAASLDAASLEAARAPGVDVPAVAGAALRQAVAEARLRQWMDENAQAFTAQTAWHERNGHPLADILASPGRYGWNA